jgi:hypothetical protein
MKTNAIVNTIIADLLSILTGFGLLALGLTALTGAFLVLLGL